MLLSNQVNSDLRILIERIAGADVVKINDELYTITKRGFEYRSKTDLISLAELEDHDMIFETDHHRFSWWEVREESKRLNNSEWSISGVDVGFYALEPLK